MRFDLGSFLRCLFSGHQWKNSNTKPGYRTCNACGIRRRY
jgi:hypothetical protein